MSWRRDTIDWPPEADEFPMLDDYGKRITPEKPSLWRWIWSFFTG